MDSVLFVLLELIQKPLNVRLDANLHRSLRAISVFVQLVLVEMLTTNVLIVPQSVEDFFSRDHVLFALQLMLSPTTCVYVQKVLPI